MTPERIKELGRFGRHELLSEIARLEQFNAEISDNLTGVQTRCTERLLEVRQLRADRRRFVDAVIRRIFRDHQELFTALSK